MVFPRKPRVQNRRQSRASVADDDDGAARGDATVANEASKDVGGDDVGESDGDEDDDEGWDGCVPREDDDDRDRDRWWGLQGVVGGDDDASERGGGTIVR